MNQVPVPLLEALQSIAAALLIGLLVGFEREAAREGHQAGVRDFLLIALVGGICGILQNSWLTGASLLSITILLAVFHFQTARTGITTEITAVATFSLGYLAAVPGFPPGAPLAIGTTIVVVAFLAGKRWLHTLIRERVTEAEFNDTLWFLAIIFIIYPVLPPGEFGPYGFFNPRRIWLFVILVSSISYVGYFSEKFLGTHRGLALTAILGGIASTTAATAGFARSYAFERQKLKEYWQATVIANTVLFPRVFVILLVFNSRLAYFALPVLGAMTAAGVLFALFLNSGGEKQTPERELPLGNPFRLGPALKLAAIFTVVVFFTRAAAAEYGGQGVSITSALSGSVDVDAVSISLAELTSAGAISLAAGTWSLLLALAANAVVKTLLALSGGALSFRRGTAEFGWRVAQGFAAMFAVGAAVWVLI